MIKIIQIKGSNGTGKTTLVKLIGAWSETWTHLQWPDNTIYATVFDDCRYVAIGKYEPDKAMGGCDLMPSIDAIKRAIKDVRHQYPGHWIVFEGMMISTIKSTFYDFLLKMRVPGKVEPLFVILKSSPEQCVKRIQGRGTMKPGLKVDNIAQKCEMVVRHAKEYDPTLVRWIKVDEYDLDTILGDFLWQVYDEELIDAIFGDLGN